jgi:hypothetical protein
MKLNFLHYFRLVISAFVLSIASGLIILIAGFVFKWVSPVQYSNALFLTATIFFISALVIVLIGIPSRIKSIQQDPQPDGELSVRRQAKKWFGDILKVYGLFMLFLLTSIFLFGISILVGSLAG